MNRRLARLFGRGGGEGGGSRPPAPLGGGGPGAGWGLLMVAGAVAAVWLCTGFYSVREGQVGVVSTFGRYAGTTGPGFQWRAPWPIQAHEIVDVFLLRKVEIGTRARGPQERLKESLMLTDDENIVDVQFEVQYRVKDTPDGARDFLYGSRFGRERDPSSVVAEAAESSMREAIGRRRMDDILGAGRQQIGDDVRARTQQLLDRYATGILVGAVAIQNAQPPEQVQAAFDEAVKAAQDRDRLVSEGEAYANDVVPKARATAAQMAQQAEGYRARVTETAEGDAARFRQVLAEYAKAPAVTRERMYLDTMRDVFTNSRKILVDVKGAANLLQLPLDKLAQPLPADGSVRGSVQGSAGAGGTTAQSGSGPSSGASAGSSSASGGPAPSPSTEAPSDRGRDGQRSRDREAR